MMLVERQHLFERVALAGVVAGQALRHGEVHPQVGQRSIGGDRGTKLPDCFGGVAGFKCVETEFVAHAQVGRVKKRCLAQGSARVGRPTNRLRVRRGGKMALDLRTDCGVLAVQGLSPQ